VYQNGEWQQRFRSFWRWISFDDSRKLTCEALYDNE
jgi:hypothetical protein